MGRQRQSVGERLWSQVESTPLGCWMWTGSTDTHGYGRMKIDGRYQPTHRVAYELLVGPIPNGLVIDHLCRNRACLNPAHVEPVANAENVLRGVGPTARNASKTHCVNGHEFTVETTIIRGSGPRAGRRACRTCKRSADARRRKAAATP